MFNVKNKTMPNRQSNVVTITKLRKEEYEVIEEGQIVKRYTIFATCSDNRTRRCHLWRYEGNQKEFAYKLLDAMNNKSSVRFIAFGGFSADNWFGNIEIVEKYVPNDLDIALAEAFKDLDSLA